VGVKRVHVIFKTHLDVGFTDLAASVIERYEREFIPQAIRLAEQCELPNGRKQFIWTTGSFLIDHYLRTADPSSRDILTQAIGRGYIAWHGLPVSMHSELLDLGLFQHGLTMAKRLDRQFGRTTIAAKMTDVPGHSIAIVPPLAAAGIRYLHIGVNPASSRPRVPKMFLWRAQEGSELVVHYADTYGDDVAVAGMDEVLVFLHAGDNQSPPDAKRIAQWFAQLEQKYPGAEVLASTLDAYAATVWANRGRLPIVTEEIGDTWIHGAGSDPKKIADFRELMRRRRKWLEEGRIKEDDIQTFSDRLLMVAEHTWGVDHKTFLGDFLHYSKPEFRRARQKNRVDGQAVPKKYDYLGRFSAAVDRGCEAPTDASDPIYQSRSYRFLESSWEEQRQYVADAVRALPDDLRDGANRALQGLKPSRQDVSQMTALPLEQEHRLGRFVVRFGSDGAIHSLRGAEGREWVGDRCPIGLFSYETLGVEDYQRWFQQYVVHWKDTYSWADADFGKPGFEFSTPTPRHRRFRPDGASAWLAKDGQGDRVTLSVRMADQATRIFGCPHVIELEYVFLHDSPTVMITLQWFQKDAVRIPEAAWFSLGFAVDSPFAWVLEKLGRPISPWQVVRRGNRAMHAVDRGIFYHAADGRVALSTLDAPVLSLGERNILNFIQEVPDLDGGFHFNLHNNVWGTNFPAWYEEDAKFRFEIQLEDFLL